MRPIIVQSLTKQYKQSRAMQNNSHTVRQISPTWYFDPGRICVNGFSFASPFAFQKYDHIDSQKCTPRPDSAGGLTSLEASLVRCFTFSETSPKTSRGDVFFKTSLEHRTVKQKVRCFYTMFQFSESPLRDQANSSFPATSASAERAFNMDGLIFTSKRFVANAS